MQPPLSLVNWQNRFTAILKRQYSSPLPRGFDLYQNDYLQRMEKSLSDYYPSLPVLLGEKVWLKEIVHPFLKECPSLRWQIKDWAEQLPNWLISSQKQFLSPMLIPLALLEQLHIRAFFSDILPLPTQDQISTGTFAHQPHLHFFSSPYPLISYRQQLLDGKSISPVKNSEEQWIALSLNQHYDVELHELSKEEHLFLGFLHHRTLEEALSYVATHHDSFLTTIATHIRSWTQRWITLNWLSIQTDL